MRVEGHKLIAECSAYDFKSELERKKIRDWLKSISAYANGGKDETIERYPEIGVGDLGSTTKKLHQNYTKNSWAQRLS